MTNEEIINAFYIVSSPMPEVLITETSELMDLARTDERNRIIKLISQMPELGAGVNANHVATVEQVALRDRIIEVITK